MGISQIWYEINGKNGAGTAILEKAGFNATVKAAKTAVMAIRLVSIRWSFCLYLAF
jgi:hypothetical protein